MDTTRNATLGALHLRMAGVADENDLASLAAVVAPFLVHLGHQRTGGVDDREVTTLGFLLHRGGDTVRAENGHRAQRNFVEFLDKDGTLGAQRFHHVLVVHDLMANIDRRSVK
jgi:hypothetical protein